MERFLKSRQQHRDDTLTGSLITDLKIQADDNDWYHVEHMEPIRCGTIFGTLLLQAAGAHTSSDLGTSFVTDAFRLTASPGDYLYAVSQFEATGEKLGKGGDGNGVPEGGLTAALLGAALGLLGIARRFIRG